jgi:hypothetical protein
MQKTIDKEYLNSRLSFLMQTPEERLNRKNNLTEENKEKLLSLKNIHKGKRCFIIGTSPSINDLDLTRLNDEITFTVNRGYNLVERGLTNSNYHIMSDIHTLKDENVAKEIPLSFTNEFLIYGGIDFPIKKNITYFDFVSNPNTLKQNLKDEITDPFLSCTTVIAYALQFAYFMGFEEVNIIGVDLDFSNIMGHAYSETSGEKERQQDGSVKLAKRMLDGITDISLQMIDKDIKVQNASPSGILNDIPRVVYDSLFKGVNND